MHLFLQMQYLEQGVVVKEGDNTGAIVEHGSTVVNIVMWLQGRLLWGCLCRTTVVNWRW